MTTLDEQIVLKHGELFVVCDEHGDIRESGVGAGFYFRDMRHLSTFVLTLEDSPLELLSNGTDAIDHQVVYLTNEEIIGDGSAMPQTVAVVRRREIHGELIERVTVRNFNREPVKVSLHLAAAADFRDLFDIRGLYMNRETQPQRPFQEQDGYYLVYESVDGTRYQTRLDVIPAPTETAIYANTEPDDARGESRGAPTVLPGHDRLSLAVGERNAPMIVLCHDLEIGPGGSKTVEYRVQPLVEPSDEMTEEPRQIDHGIHSGPFEEWHGGRGIAEIVTDNQVFNEVLHRSLSDLRTLITPLPTGGTIIAAGIPWYVAPFGRDSLIACRQLLPFNHHIMAATLRYLASMQGDEDDQWRDEEPGKIVHEIRYGEMARRNLVPFSRYYGTVDATPLFLMMIAEYLDWTDNRALFDELRGRIDRALSWIDEWGDSSGDGFVDYRRRSDRGLDNQGWKDSDNSLQRPDGSPVPGPIALVEVQGYVYAAKLGIAAHAERYGEQELAERLRQDAEQLRHRIEERFWVDALRFYAQALDGEGSPVTAIASNPGHLLAAGVPDPRRAGAVTDCLLSPQMFSGWGVRTLSRAMPHYNPVSYHNGSVWPHDNGFILWGLRRYRQFDALERIAGALFDAAVRFRYYRLPELMCGFARGAGPRDTPVSYPVSCSPQAWAAGVPLVIVETLLGLRPDSANGQIILDPWLPDWLGVVEIRDLRVGGHSIDLRIRGYRDQVDVRVLRNPDGLGVTIGGSG